jgi:hypothetical protein
MWLAPVVFYGGTRKEKPHGRQHPARSSPATGRQRVPPPLMLMVLIIGGWVLVLVVAYVLFHHKEK